MTANIRKLREEKWFSQQQVAEYLGTTRQTYSNFEKWTSDIPLLSAVKLAELLGITLEQLSNLDATEESTMETDREKYKSIIQTCITYGSGSDGKITKTKLAKLCYLVDFTWFYTHLQSLTGLEYRRIQQWPVPDAYFGMIDELESQEAIAVTKRWKAYMIENISDKVDNLEVEELSLIKKICKKRQKADTQEIVHFTHGQLPWMMCKEKEIIPYEFITQEEPDNVY